MRRAAFYLIAALVVALDQVAKAWALAALSGGRTVSLIPGTLVLNLVHNRGSAFGMFQGGAVALALVAAVAIGLMIWIERRGLASGWLRVAVAMQLGGAIGNFIDRVRFQYVVDFIELDWKGRNIWPVFNVADMAITTGTVILVLWLLRAETSRQPASPLRGEPGTETHDCHADHHDNGRACRAAPRRGVGITSARCQPQRRAADGPGRPRHPQRPHREIQGPRGDGRRAGVRP
jgi:signal peptidase II